MFSGSKKLVAREMKHCRRKLLKAIGGGEIITESEYLGEEYV